MSREYRNLVLSTKAAPEADLEEKRGLNYLPPGHGGGSYVGYHQRAKRGGGLMPKGAKNRARLAKIATRVTRANADHAASMSGMARRMSPAELRAPKSGVFRSGADRHRELTRQAGMSNRTAFGAGRVAARLKRGGKFPRF